MMLCFLATLFVIADPLPLLVKKMYFEMFVLLKKITIIIEIDIFQLLAFYY